jgi:mycothiol synthase
MREFFQRIFGYQPPRQETTAMAPLRMFADLDEKPPARVNSLPSGYGLVADTRHRHDEWIELLNSAGDLGFFDRSVFKREILSTMIPSGGILVEHAGDIVGCAAVCLAKRFAPNCLLNYVLVGEQHRGRGIGAFLSREAMDRARAAGYDGMVLQTDEKRLPAIALYTALGFKPVLDADPDADVRWRNVQITLGLAPG